MRKAILALLAASVLTVPTVTDAAGGDATPEAIPAPSVPEKQRCDERCHLKRDYRKLRRSTSREPIPEYIVECESHGYLRAQNPSGAGGRYQIMPSTWAANLPSRQWIRIAEQIPHRRAQRLRRHHRPLDSGPRWSGRLLQDKVAASIWADSGPGAWSCS